MNPYPVRSEEYKPNWLILFNFLIEVSVGEVGDPFQTEDPCCEDKEYE